MKQLMKFSFICAFAIMAFSSCSKDERKSRLTVYLTDAPASYDAVNVEVLRAEIKVNNDDSENGWQSLPLVKAGVYNLLDYTNGEDTLLASVEIPAGKISQLRLILGNGNTIVVDGQQSELPLETPSAQTSGLKFNIHADLIAGIEYKMWIDFNAARSVVVTGTGTYKLKPVIRTFTEAASGAIQGYVLPGESESLVHAISGTDTLTAIPEITDGRFLIRGVPPGTWKIYIDGNNGYTDRYINDVIVTLGQVKDVGTSILEK